MNKLCIAGKNDIAVNALHYLVESGMMNKENILVIPNGTDSGIDEWQKSLKKAAETLGVRISSLEEVYSIENLIFLSLEFDKIVKIEKFKSQNLFNIHFSKLPKYKGMYTSIMPILNGETTSGVTLHKIDNGIDTGEIIAQKEFELDKNDTARDLYFKYLKNAFELFKENISNIISGEYTSYRQPAAGASYYSKKSINFKEIVIDLNKTSYEIHNQIRGFIFEEYQLPEINGKRIKQSILTDNFIGFNKCKELEDKFIISGIDGYEIWAIKGENL